MSFIERKLSVNIIRYAKAASSDAGIFKINGIYSFSRHNYSRDMNVSTAMTPRFGCHVNFSRDTRKERGGPRNGRRRAGQANGKGTGEKVVDIFLHNEKS